MTTETKMNAANTELENLEIGISELMAETGVSRMKAITALQGAAAKQNNKRGDRSLYLLCNLKSAYMEKLGLCKAWESEAFISQVEKDAGLSS